MKGKNSVVGIAFGVLLAQGVKRLPGWLRRITWRWRRVLTPLWCATAVWFIAVLLRWSSPRWMVVGVLVAFAGGTLGVLGPRLSERVRAVVMKLVPEGLDRGKNGVLDRPAERIYLTALSGWVGLYLVARIQFGGSAFTALLWQVGLLLFGGSWWYHRRVRVAGRADRYARKWGRIRDGRTSALELKALAGSRPVKVITVGNSARLRIKLAEAVTADHVARCAEPLASYFGMRVGSVFPQVDESSARHVWFQFLPKDPWAGKLQHPLPSARSTSLALTRGLMDMGVLADGTPVSYRLQHTLVVGQNGSGKSVWLESLLIFLMSFTDCMVAGIDMASGATLGMFRRILALPLATDLDSAVVVLERVLAFIVDRETRLGLDKETDDEAPDFVAPGVGTPWLVLIIEEFPDLIALGGTEVVALLGRIGKRARKAGVVLIMACQNGSKTDTGSKELQSQLKCVVGLRLDPHANRVLWGELVRQGWTCSHLTTGQFLIRDNEHTTPDPSKGWFVSPKDRRAHVAEAADSLPVAEASAVAALHGVGGVEQEVTESLPRPERIPVDAILAILRDDGPHGADALAALLGPTEERPTPIMSRATVYRRLDKHETRGYAHKVSTTWHFGSRADCGRCRADEPPAMVDGEVA